MCLTQPEEWDPLMEAVGGRAGGAGDGAERAWEDGLLSCCRVGN